jgi:hypothetical protein
MYVETGIPLRIPYRQAFTVAGANADMRRWNKYCNVNWTAYKFSRLNGRGVDISSIIIDKFYVDIDVYQEGEKVNVESAPRLEEMLEKMDARRLWVSTAHGFNCYIKAPSGASPRHVESLFKFLQREKVDVDPCIVDPLAQRKAVGSVIHDNATRVTPLTGEEVVSMDVDKINEEIAKHGREEVKSYWNGRFPFTDRVLAENMNVPAKFDPASISVDGTGWQVNQALVCPAIQYVAGKTRPDFFERLDLLKYLKIVLGVDVRNLEGVAEGMIGREEWRSMSGHKHIVLMAAGSSKFDPLKLKMRGYCPKNCWRCQEMAEAREHARWVLARDICR